MPLLPCPAVVAPLRHAALAACLVAVPLLGMAADAPTLAFDQFFSRPIGPRGLEWSETLRAAHGQHVRLVGHVVAQERPPAGQFLLTPRPVRLSEHADGEADDLPPSTVLVLLPQSQRDRVVMHRDQAVALTGQLQLGRQEDATGRVSWIRLLLDDDVLTP